MRAYVARRNDGLAGASRRRQPTRHRPPARLPSSPRVATPPRSLTELPPQVLAFHHLRFPSITTGPFQTRPPVAPILFSRLADHSPETEAGDRRDPPSSSPPSFRVGELAAEPALPGGVPVGFGIESGRRSNRHRRSTRRGGQGLHVEPILIACGVHNNPRTSLQHAYLLLTDSLGNAVPGFAITSAIQTANKWVRTMRTEARSRAARDGSYRTG